MKNTSLTILISITLAMVCVMLVSSFLGNKGTLPITSTNTTTTEDNTIKVYGQGKVSIKPDVAYITLGIENMDMSPKIAHDNNSKQINKVINALKDAGIAHEDIQTSRYNIYPEYIYSDNDRKLKGYKVTNTITIKVKEIEKSSDMIDVAFNAGGNIFQGISFDILDRQEAYLKAMDLALERAKQKADAFAKKTGKTVIDVKEINEDYVSSGYRHQPMSNFIQGQGMSAKFSASTGSISAGELQIVAKVNVTYKLGN